jgi:hypothetical protein
MPLQRCGQSAAMMLAVRAPQWLYFTSFRGFIGEPRSRPLAYKELGAKTTGMLNGWGNVYRVPVSVLDAAP